MSFQFYNICLDPIPFDIKSLQGIEEIVYVEYLSLCENCKQKIPKIQPKLIQANAWASMILSVCVCIYTCISVCVWEEFRARIVRKNFSLHKNHNSNIFICLFLFRLWFCRLQPTIVSIPGSENYNNNNKSSSSSNNEL